MTKRRILVATLVLVPGLLYPAAVSPAAGQADSPPSPPTPQRTAWAIGAEIYGFKYEESVMEEEGLFLGFNVGYTSRPWLTESQTESTPEGGLMFGIEGRFAFGQVDYDGALLDGTPYTIDNIDDYTLEARAILGADQLSSVAMHTIYTGLGYRYLNDDLSSDPAGYERESNYLYLPLGYQFGAGLDSGWSWAARFEYDIFLWGEQRSHLSDVPTDPPDPDVENEQDEGFGYRVSVTLRREYSSGVLIIEPFFRFWDIEDSEISLGWFEPANETTEYGIRFIWMF